MSGIYSHLWDLAPAVIVLGEGVGVFLQDPNTIPPVLDAKVWAQAIPLAGSTLVYSIICKQSEDATMNVRRWKSYIRLVPDNTVHKGPTLPLFGARGSLILDIAIASYSTTIFFYSFSLFDSLGKTATAENLGGVAPVTHCQ